MDVIGSGQRIEALPIGVLAALAMGAIRMETVYEAVYHERGREVWRAKAKNRVVTVGLNKLLDATFKTGLASPGWFVGLVGASITDAAITSGSPNLTSASNLWVAADAGRSIIVRGAGASGADLVTTILTFSSAGAVVLASNAGTTVTGAKATWDARAADTMSSHSPWTDTAPYSNGMRPAFTPGAISAGSVDNSASQASFSINVDTSDIFGLFLVDNNTVSGTSGTLYGMAPFASPGSQRMNSGGTLNVTATLSAAST